MVICLCANTVKNGHYCEDLRVLVLFGSPRNNGPTAKLLNSFLGSLPAGAKVEIYDCFKNSPAPCDDCRYCHYVEGCSYSDLDDFYGKLENANVLVFATPVYNLSFPAPLKAVIDRMQRYWSARFKQGIRPPIEIKKQAYLLTTCGCDSAEEGKMLEKQLKPVLTILNAKLAKSVHFTGADRQRPMDESIAAAMEAAKQLEISS